MAAYYKSKGMSLFDAMEEIYQEYGYYSDALDSYTFKGIEGQDKIKNIVNKFQNHEELLKSFDNITIIEEYQLQLTACIETGKKKPIDLPKADVIKVCLKDGDWFAVRPSGTEPKLKIYYSTAGEAREISEEKMGKLQEKALRFISWCLNQ